MADPEPNSEEALTREEIQSTPEAQPPAGSSGEKRKNACTVFPLKPSHFASQLTRAQTNTVAALMAPKKKAPAAAKPARSTGGNPFKDRMGLGAYLGDPSSFSASVVIAHSPDFVVIHDKFPKATVHTLIVPRSSAVNLQHPFDALADPSFLALIKTEVAKTKALVAAELQRRLGQFSAAESTRQAVLNGEADAEGEGELPKGRDWAAEVMCGVHAVPSMSHLHIHVLSRDMHSEKMKHRKHYNSFNTPFLVDVEDFPLAEDDPRRDTGKAGYLKRDLVCWRCGRNFGNKFAQLKEHLETEFDAWKRE